MPAVSGGQILDESFLPGFERLDATREAIARLSDADIDRRFPAHTGANLKTSNPRLYAVAARLFYEFGFSQREIAVMCQIGRDTVAAIVEAEQGTGRTIAQRRARLTRIRRLGERALANLEGLLADEEAVRKAGPVAMASIWKTLEDAGLALEQDLDKLLLAEQPEEKAEGLDEAAKYLEA